MKGKKSTQFTEAEHKAAIYVQKRWKGFAARKAYPKMLKKHRKKIFTVKELIQSERTYC